MVRCNNQLTDVFVTSIMGIEELCVIGIVTTAVTSEIGIDRAIITGETLLAYFTLT